MAVLGGRRFDIRFAWQDALAVMAILEEEGPVWQRWFRAIDRFYVQRVPDGLLVEAAKFLEHFLTAGQTAAQTPQPSQAKGFTWNGVPASIASNRQCVRHAPQEIHLSGSIQALGIPK